MGLCSLCVFERVCMCLCLPVRSRASVHVSLAAPLQVSSGHTWQGAHMATPSLSPSPWTPLPPIPLSTQPSPPPAHRQSAPSLPSPLYPSAATAPRLCLSRRNKELPQQRPAIRRNEELPQ